MKKKIIAFHLLNNFTGSPQVLRNVLNALDKSVYEVILYTSNTQGFLSDLNGVQVRDNYYFRRNSRVVTFITFFLSQFFLFFKLLFEIKSNKNTIFYVNTILPFAAILLGKIKGIHVICHVHEFQLSPRLLNTFLFSIVNRFANELVLVSNYMMINHYTFPNKVHIVYNTITADFEKELYQNNTKSEKFTVLMLASLRPYKGIEDFLTLARTLRQINFTLVLSESEKLVEDFKKKSDLPQNVQIQANVKNVVSCYKKSHLVLNLSDKSQCVETFGLTILEAMFVGLPVIVPQIGGITELVEHGKNGFKIDSKDHHELTKIILKLSSDQKYWKELSLNSLKMAEDFSPNVFNKRINYIIDSSFFEMKGL